ncbi:hypothetical protein JOF43_000703 [Brachybacterium sacelli]|uniref:Uncharacterized protein n=1 Tax=Brachybacterium sacelli TaxID=173364 RepID=A0ABS4WX64_9MICO|nr:hypothetical protein [Brachybacterium sacelli]
MVDIALTDSGDPGPASFLQDPRAGQSHENGSACA